MTTLSTKDDDDGDEATLHCHDCGMIASSPKEEARAKGFCHVKVFDARRRRVVVGANDDEDQQQQEAAAGGLKHISVGKLRAFLLFPHHRLQDLYCLSITQL